LVRNVAFLRSGHFGNPKSPLDNYVNQKHILSIPCPLRDGSRSSRHVGRGRRWTRRSQAQRLVFERNQDSVAGRRKAAYGEIVWSWRRDPGATLAGVFPPATGARKAASPGRARISRKTIARGKPGCLGCTCGSTRVLSCRYFPHTGLRAQSAPGFPCALSSSEGQRDAKPRADRAAGTRAHVSPHCHSGARLLARARNP
jgi:hypothetical protein